MTPVGVTRVTVILQWSHRVYNPAGIDAAEFCSPMTHRGFNALASICLRADQLGAAASQNKCKWMTELKKLQGKSMRKRDQLNLMKLAECFFQ